jgi:hypothetical protein
MKALILISALLLTQSQEAPPAIAGKWLWQGPAGWQRIVLDLKVQGSKLTGVVRMGPGGVEPKSPEEYWEFFFDATDFKISNGKIEGNTIYFEHEATKTLPGISLSIPSGTTAGIARVVGAGAAASFNTNQPRSVPSKFIYRGVLDAQRITLTRETVSREGDPWVLGRHAVEFSLERMK